MINLHTHSYYSVLDGFCSPTDIAKAIKDMGQNEWALTDHGTLSGVIEAYKASMELGLKFIFGIELYIVPDVTVKTRESRHVVFYAKNQIGYHNLIKLDSEAHKNFYYTPRCDPDMVEKYKEGLICTTACLSGMLNDKTLAERMLSIFGKDFYVEIHTNTMKIQDDFNNMACDWAIENNVKMVMACDAHYIQKAQAKVHKIFNKLSKNESAWSVDDYYLRDDSLLKNSFFNKELVGKCEQCHPPKGHFYPKYQTDDAKSELRRKMWDGWNVKMLPKSQEYVDRAKHEVDILGRADYYNYLLMVSDICDFARRNNIPTGDGRGSVVGSLASYLLGITTLDPIKYDLLFERFVHLERISAPDADIDFSKRRRQEIIEYIKMKYGNVNHIRTFGYMGDKAALRKLGQALDLPQSDITAYAKLLGDKPLESAKLPKEFKDIAIAMRGTIANYGTHASGILVCPFDTTDYIPIELQVIKRDGKEIKEYVAAWDFEYLEEMGFLKMDILGLGTLDVIHDTVECDFDSVPDDDKATFDMLCNGDTFGVFQIESDGMTKLVKQLQPRSIHDLIPLVALYRPGPMDSGMLAEYVARKTGVKVVEYYDPKLEPVLKETYGIIVYQEQVMKIAQVLGGYSLGEADVLRRAIGKKKADALVQLSNELRERCILGGVSDIVADKIVHDIITFGNYGFNKSHAAAYAYTAFKTAYLKAHHPNEFCCALLNSEIGEVKKTAEYLEKIKIPILPVDLMKSKIEWSIEPEGLRIGFNVIKGFNMKECINVPTIEEFITVNKLNKRHIDALNNVFGTDPIKQRDVLGFTIINSLELYDISLADRRNDIIGGEVVRIKPHTMKNGKPMFFVDMKDKKMVHSLAMFSAEKLEIGEVYLAQVRGTAIEKISKAPRRV